MPQPPNILFIFTDQQSADAMSCAGTPDLHTPAMDELAARGVRFERAYCAQPLCTPSRASLMTGRYPHELGVTVNQLALGENDRAVSMGRVLGQAGYDCAYAGKWHLPHDTPMPEGHGFRRLCPRNDHKIADACAAYLAQRRDQPFLLIASLDNPHNICEWARRQPLPWGPIDEPPVERCPALPANFAVPPYEPDALRIEQQHQPYLYPVQRYTPDDWRRYRNAYRRLCEKADHEVGRILEALRRSGHADHTLIVFSSDHGDGQGAHQWNQKHALYEESVRIPLIVSPPGGGRASVDPRHLVSNGLDLLPTFCDYAGAPIPGGVRGKSLRPLLEGGEPNDWRDAVFVETQFASRRTLGTRGRMVRTDRYKYVIYSWGRHREQLFDLCNDPGEMVNLAAHHEHREVLDRCRGLLSDWIESHDDKFPMPQLSS